MRPKARLRALEGLTVAIKDEGAIKHQRSTLGTLLFRDNVAPESDVFNERILKAGAICHARTATPEFCCAPVPHSRFWGVTRNPWNLGYTPGGSSGGSAAALAAGKGMPDGLSWCMTYPFNMLSRCPVMTVPSGFAANGVPSGVQIVGPTYDDVRVFEVAGAFEEAAPWTYIGDGVPKFRGTTSPNGQ